MTARLYYTDAYCTCFSACVVERLDAGDPPAVVLDRTAFYPASGGQPADRGALDGVAVTDVVVREEDNAVVHVLECALAGDGACEVEGGIDWQRRFDHMQQHTGQHILSAAFERLLDADTVGFHLGADVSTVDIDVARLEWAALEKVEDLANQVVWENHSVDARFVEMGELPVLSLRRVPAVEGPMRIVEIAGFDVTPCGGTHVAHTGEIGLIKISRLDHRGDETRVEFLCGSRALRDYRARSAAINQLAARLTVGYWELDEAVERLRGEAKQLRQELRQAREQLLEVEAVRLAESAVPQGAYHVVRRVWGAGRSPEELRALAKALAQCPGVVVLLAGVGERTHLCFACAGGVDVDAAALLREACGRLGGKGGGQPHMAQGSAPVADPARVEAVLAELALDF
jgi:alanyl-tRNA synthetase